MTDIRARLADALREHREITTGPLTCRGCSWSGWQWGEHLADVLLSLPDITIMDVALLEGTERACLEEYERRRSSFVWAPTAARWKHKAEGIRYAIDTAALLAAANAAEETTQ